MGERERRQPRGGRRARARPRQLAGGLGRRAAAEARRALAQRLDEGIVEGERHLVTRARHLVLARRAGVGEGERAAPPLPSSRAKNRWAGGCFVTEARPPDLAVTAPAKGPELSVSTSEVAGGGISRTLAIAESGKCTSALYDDDDATTSRPSVRTSTSDALRSKQRSNASRRYDPLLSAIITRWAVASEREYTCSACSGPWSIRGGRTRSPSADSPSMNSNVLAIPCVRPEARSKTPAAGLTIAPPAPSPFL